MKPLLEKSFSKNVVSKNGKEEIHELNVFAYKNTLKNNHKEKHGA